jgi:GT2 family glycosyltransferase
LALLERAYQEVTSTFNNRVYILEANLLPFVSVIVTALNNEELMKNCHVSLLQTVYPPERREFIIVDNGSTDRTAEIIKSFPVQYLYERRRGVSYARNRGIEASIGEIVAFTDPDCVVSTVWLNELVNAFDEQDVGGVAGAIIPYPGQTSAERYAARIRSHTQERPMSHPLHPFAMTPNIAFRREVFQRIGYFDTRFPGGGWEDADLCWRFFRETNLKLKYPPRAVVFHRYRTTAKAFFIQHVRYGYGLAILFTKYNEEISWDWRERAQAYKNLIVATWVLANNGSKWIIRKCTAEEFDIAYFGFLRRLGQRLGFLRGSFSGKWSYSNE